MAFIPEISYFGESVTSEYTSRSLTPRHIKEWFLENNVETFWFVDELTSDESIKEQCKEMCTGPILFHSFTTDTLSIFIKNEKDAATLKLFLI